MISYRSADEHLSVIRQCADMCRTTLFDYCLKKGGAHASPDHVQRMMDCIELCRTAVDFIARGSAQRALVCRACAEICRHCAAACAQFDDDAMRHCAELCRVCADSCDEMALEIKHSIHQVA